MSVNAVCLQIQYVCKYNIYALLAIGEYSNVAFEYSNVAFEYFPDSVKRVGCDVTTYQATIARVVARAGLLCNLISPKCTPDCKKYLQVHSFSHNIIPFNLMLYE